MDEGQPLDTQRQTQPRSPDRSAGPDGRVSGHYVGERGLEYARWQHEQESGVAWLHSRRFQGFVAHTDTVLDFGCGDGEILARINCGRRIGVDPVEASRIAARTNGLDTYASINELSAASVDVVISNHALEHCTRPLDELIGVRRALKSEGRLILIVPINDWRWSSDRQYRPGDHNHHLYTWTPLLLGNLLSDAGFRVEQITVESAAVPPRKLRQIWQRFPPSFLTALIEVQGFLTRYRQIRAVARSSGQPISV
jgi:SAM-dependent methyltransferase